MSSIVDMFDRVNLDTPGLEAVKAAIEAEDYSAAAAAYLEYYRSRKPPVLDWHTEHRGGRSFETNSTGWNFLTTIPEVITWRDREKVKGLISREKGYTFSRTKPNLQGWYCGGGPRPTPAPCVAYRRTGMLPTIFQTVLSPMKAYEAALPRVESLGVPGDGWIRITLPNGREDIYCSPLEAGYQQLENIAFTGDATLIRHDSDGTLLDWAVIGGDNLQYRGEILPATRE